ncbi:hypothetical protein U0070_013672 [Myodes glareolus]|uniref:OTU domain-containing protein n=1 Tax=Myodes glareolus TaxID=447135 RepID=A0AAW0JP50_MYOGA
MYRVLEDQLREQDYALTVAALWKRTAEYMQSHSEDFLPFLTNPNTGNVYAPEEFEKYCDDIVNTAAWGVALLFLEPFSTKKYPVASPYSPVQGVVSLLLMVHNGHRVHPIGHRKESMSYH